jgi:hypothetical protein
MAGNDFDTSVMPSARAARRQERRMLIPLPAFVAIVAGVALLVIGAGYLGIIGR